MKQRLAAASVAWLIGVGVTAPLAAATRPSTVPLAGEWRFALDREDRGVKEAWFRQALADRIRLPGSLQAQGFGNEVTALTRWVSTLEDKQWYLRAEYRQYAAPGNVRIPFLLQPDRHYVGVAWYQRSVQIPLGWRGRRIVLTLERPHWQTEVWIDDRHVGVQDSLGTPHSYDLGQVAPGRHELTIRVDNRLVVDVGANAHSVTDHTQTDWNGIVGDIEMRSTSPVWIDDVQVFPNVARKTALVKAVIGNGTGVGGAGRLAVGGRSFSVAWDATGGRADVELPLGPTAETWDEFRPALQRLRVHLTGGPADDVREVVFGLREIGIEGTWFTMNGRRIYLRGTNETCSFPLTGYPPTDVASWKRIIRIAQEHGLNHMRFHSWCPPEAAFIAADELGFYLQPECSIWARDGARIDRGTPLERWLYEESERMMKAYGNHPSFVLLTHGNEPEGDWQESLSRWVDQWKQRDPRRLFGADTGWPMRHELGHVTGTQFYVVTRVGQNVARGPKGWNGKDYRVVVDGTDVPIVSHEIGQHSGFVNFDEAAKYTGVLKPRNFQIFWDSLAQNGLVDQAKAFLMASGRLQLLAYKEDVEASLRTPRHAGFQLLDLHDYPGQGTSLIGILDSFWDPKPYATAVEFRRFCNTTVPLARLSSRTLTTDETLQVEVEAAHFGQAPLAGIAPEWKVVATNGAIAARGALARQTIGIGNGQSLGRIELALAALPAPAQYKLAIALPGTPFENDWNFWVYPKIIDTAAPDGVRFATALDAEALGVLEGGGSVLLLPPPDQMAWESPPFGFVPVFWNRQLFPKWDRPLGILVDPGHPALRGFPTESHSDWQWESLLRPTCRAINVTALPRDLRPIVQGIDDWNRNYKLALVFEARVGRGRLLVSALDLETDADRLPAKRQFLAGLLRYMASDAFSPSTVVSEQELRGLFFDNKAMARQGARATADVESERDGARNAVDGDPTTIWRTPNGTEVPPFPHELTIDLERPARATGLVVMAQQRDRQRIGEIKDYVIDGSEDGTTWVECARGVLDATYEPQRIAFPRAVLTRRLRFRALSSHDGGPVAALAELALVLEGAASVAPGRSDPGRRPSDLEVAPDEVESGAGGATRPRPR